MTEFSLFVPCSIWTANTSRRLHHYALAEKVSVVRQKSKLYGLNAIRNKEVQPYAEPVTIGVWPVQKPGVLADVCAHAVTFKAMLDGIVDAGILVDDSPEWVESVTFYQPTKSRVTGMRITIKPVPEV